MPSDSTFDGVAASYDEQLGQGLALTGEAKGYFAAGRVRCLRETLAALRAEPRRVVDYGCGNGDTLPLLGEAFPGCEVVGFEPSRGLADEARRRHPGLRFYDPARPLSAGTADVVYCNCVLHHVPRSERPGFVAALVSALRPGGYLALSENNPLNPGTRFVMRRIPFDREADPLTPGQTARLLRSAGLEVSQRRFLFLFPAFLRFLRPLERRLQWLPVGGQYLILARRPQGQP